MKSFDLDPDTLLSIAVAVLDVDAVLLDANAGFLRLLPQDGTRRIGARVSRYFIQPDFPALRRAVERDGVHGYRGLMTIGDRSDRTRTLTGHAWRGPSGINVLAEYDIAELERLNDIVLEMNRESTVAQQGLARANVTLKQREALSVEASLTDALTGVGNRRRLDQALAAEISRVQRHGGALSVIMADIDLFKQVNDEHGHAVGDKVLVHLGGLLKSRTRSTDVVARFGGEEFFVLMPHTRLPQAAAKAERLRSEFAALTVDPLPGVVTSSFGVAELAPGETGESLLKRVDAALYQAKKTGRNRVIAAQFHQSSGPSAQAVAAIPPSSASPRNIMSAMNHFDEAIAFAQAHEIPWPRDPAADPAHWGVHHEDPPPFNVLRGPVHPRGGVSGVIRVRGEEVAAWGEPDRADQTFSVAKTYLALLAGIAHARGMLEPGERVSDRLPGIGFDSTHNRAITWEHLLTQTSEWQGECFGMPDQVEHYRRVSHDPKPVTGKKGDPRPLREPGGYWEYNDVRINQFALALLHLFKRPLPELFLESVLQPIGGGRDFRWEGYDDAWVELDGRRVQSVTGGTHWGGGVSISARDQARIGQLLLDGGMHQGAQVLPREWVRHMHTPCAVAPFYGWLTWLNRDGQLYADASRASWFMFGAGGHTVWIDPDHDAVVVTRWLDGAHSAGFVSRVAQALGS